MANYFRGWKKASSRNPLFQRLERRSTNYAPSGSGKKFPARLLFGLFSAGKKFFRWVFLTKGVWKKIVILGAVAGLILFIFFGLLFVYYSFNLPDPNKLAERVLPESTKIFDRNGKLLYEIHGEARRTLVTLDQIPKYAKEATIAIEDKNFYKHGGISFVGIARSIVVNLISARKAQGGSTITQQFVRNAVLTREKTWARKLKEIALSLQLERRYSKDEILQLYFNEIPFGSTIYGIEAASQSFFGKSAKDLTLAEAAYLAAIPKAPTYYSPYGPNRSELDARADTVLQLMYEQGYTTETERNRAQNEKVEFRNIGTGILAPHFVLYIQDLLAQKYGEISLQEGGLKVTTTLDLELQKIAEEAVAKQGTINEEKYKAKNAALVSIDPKTGQILAMVGSRDYFNDAIDGQVNVALRPRQPGSSFKPYVYATAFKKGMNPATMLLDVTTNFGIFGGKEYIPQDYDGKNRGPTSIRSALQGSLNIPAVKTLILTGIEDSIQTAENLGITTLKDRSRFGPSIVLGGADVKLLEHTAAFGVFATNGIRHETAAILKVEDRQGNILEEYKDGGPGKEVLNPQITYQINNILSDNESRIYIFGRNNRLTLPGRPAAAKTGTTQENRDNWVIGYTPSLVTGVWVGNNDNSEMAERAFGSSTTAPIWQEFMTRALAGKPVEEFVRPEGITEVVVDTLSGKLPTIFTPSTKTEIFSTFNLPTEYDDVHVPVTIDGQTVIQTVLHAEKLDDPAWEEPVKAWALANGYSYLPPTQNNTGKIDTGLNVEIVSPEKISSLPWKIKASTTNSDIAELQLFLDNDFLTSTLGKNLEYESQETRVDGQHQLMIQIRTTDNRTNRKIVNLEFALSKKLLLLYPQDNQELNLPANLVLESSINIAPENVKFFRRSASGQENQISGLITKQQVGQIYRYTLNWAQSSAPASGSYALYAQIGGEKSNQVVVKIP